jgi:hypothetical protein
MEGRSNQMIVTNEVSGRIVVNCRLSGMPGTL